MLKKFGRKALSFLLVFVLMATTFFIFDPSILLPKSKAVVDVKKLVNTVEPTVKFYVPEAIYLNPVVGTGSKPYSFQYFIDSDENGMLRRSATQTTGTVYFTCSAACTSISLSWENSSVTAKTDTSSNQIVKQTITGGTTSVRDGRVKVTATYVVEGRTYHAYAYTYMYYPELDLLTGTASSYVYKATMNEPKLSAFSFITGVHMVGNKTDYGNTDERGVSNYYDQYNGSSSKGYYGISPLIPGWAHVWENGELVPGSSGAIFKTADEGRIYDRDIIYGETTSSLPTKFRDGSGNGGVYFHERERAGGTYKTYGGISNSWGILYVDTSRVTDYNQIPNLRGGFICHYYHRCGKRGELETFASDDSGITILNNVDFRNGDGHSYGMSDADRLSGAVTSTDKTYNMRATYKYRMDVDIGSSSTVTMNQDFGLKVYPVNKKSLREAYRAAIENGWQSTTASKHGWSSSAQSQWATAYGNFDAALATAGEVLGRPYATYSQVSTALSNLNNRVTACNNIVNANFQGGENPDLIPHVTFYVPEAIYLKPAASNMNTFQYYVDRENAVNGALRTGENTTGNVFFKCDEATKITSITCSGASVTLEASSSSTNTLSTRITKGTTNTTYSANGTGTLTWTVKYVVGNATYENKAYTTVYAPYTNAIASGYSARKDSGSEVGVNGILWVTGMHGYNNDKYSNASDCLGGMKYQPLLTTTIDLFNNPYDKKSKPENYLSWNGSGDGYSGFYNTDTGNGSVTGKRSGYITVDSSRYSNYNGIPNVQYGFDYLGHRFGNSSRSQKMSLNVKKQNGTTYSTYSLSYSLNGNVVIEGGGTRDGSKNWKTYYRFNSSIPVNSTPVILNGTIAITDEKRGVTTNNYLYFDTTVVNKATLRSYYNSCVCSGRQASWYTTTTWNNYQNALNAAGTILGNPLSDAAAISNAKTNLETKEKALVRLTGTVKATHIRHTDF
ncbi:MAG: FIVAR domain-containing protein, partial [Ruminococcus sp.]|nr:FIVAR domain-containing protein [Ruminococcus sp.]